MDGENEKIITIIDDSAFSVIKFLALSSSTSDFKDFIFIFNLLTDCCRVLIFLCFMQSFLFSTLIFFLGDEESELLGSCFLQ